NTDTINFFITQHDDDAKKVLDRNHIDYILIDEDFFNMLNINNSREGSMMDKLIQRKNIPDYLKFIDSNSRIHLYQYVESKNK
ncbi:MAG TPA: hypothetical protein DD638_01505, partial [Pasteurellaceae bacterium]|nr:hypothetical protein [Pasteurellaceae bacterium]